MSDNPAFYRIFKCQHLLRQSRPNPSLCCWLSSIQFTAGPFACKGLWTVSHWLWTAGFPQEIQRLTTDPLPTLNTYFFRLVPSTQGVLCLSLCYHNDKDVVLCAILRWAVMMCHKESTPKIFSASSLLETLHRCATLLVQQSVSSW